MKPLIVGEAPGKNGDPTKPIEGRIGLRLAVCMGIPFEEFLTTFDRVNLLPEQPQDSGKGMAFNAIEARKAAASLYMHFQKRPLALLLGKRVGAAFHMQHVAYFKRHYVHGIESYIVPHPSGVNRWWNNWDNELEMMRFMRNIVVPRLT